MSAGDLLVGQALGTADREVLGELKEWWTRSLNRHPARLERHLKRIEREAGARGGRHPPA